MEGDPLTLLSTKKGYHLIYVAALCGYEPGVCIVLITGSTEPISFDAE